MENKTLTSAMLSVLLLSSTTFAHSGDWQAVTDLPPGIEISVRLEHSPNIPCTFEHADEKELICEHVTYGPRGATASREFVYDRKRIREVRLERGENTNGATGVLIGGATGAAFGAAVGNGAPARVGGALFFGGLGAVFGGSIGRRFRPIQGNIIYRR